MEVNWLSNASDDQFTILKLIVIQIKTCDNHLALNIKKRKYILFTVYLTLHFLGHLIRYVLMNWFSCIICEWTLFGRTYNLWHWKYHSPPSIKLRWFQIYKARYSQSHSLQCKENHICFSPLGDGQITGW